MIVYVAKDKQGYLSVFKDIPHYDEDLGVWFTLLGDEVLCSNSPEIKELFPGITFENSPIEFSITPIIRHEMF